MRHKIKENNKNFKLFTMFDYEFDSSFEEQADWNNEYSTKEEIKSLIKLNIISVMDDGLIEWNDHDNELRRYVDIINLINDHKLYWSGGNLYLIEDNGYHV